MYLGVSTSERNNSLTETDSCGFQYFFSKKTKMSTVKTVDVNQLIWLNHKLPWPTNLHVSKLNFARYLLAKLINQLVLGQSTNHGVKFQKSTLWQHINESTYQDGYGVN